MAVVGFVQEEGYSSALGFLVAPVRIDQLYSSNP